MANPLISDTLKNALEFAGPEGLAVAQTVTRIQSTHKPWRTRHTSPAPRAQAAETCPRGLRAAKAGGHSIQPTHKRWKRETQQPRL